MPSTSALAGPSEGYHRLHLSFPLGERCELKMAPKATMQLPLPVCRASLGGDVGTPSQVDRRVHDWYRFVLSFPPHLVRDYMERFALGQSDTLLDPFCGTGTTLVEARFAGVPSVGIEGHPFTAFAAATKVDWSPDPEQLRDHAQYIADRVMAQLMAAGVPDDPAVRTGVRRPRIRLKDWTPEQRKLVLFACLSARPLHKTLALLGAINSSSDPKLKNHELLALAKTVVFTSSNLTFGPEVGLGTLKVDAPVVGPWVKEVDRVAEDLASLRSVSRPASTVILGDSREVSALLKRRSVNAVITSPPYPNEKDYTRTTRLESVLLGYVRSRDDLRAIKQGLVRSNTRGVFKSDGDDRWIRGSKEIERIASEIEARRVELGKTSGFEKLYPRVARLYFGGMYRHLASLRPALKRGARLAYVVGDQASYLRILIKTGTLLGEIGEALGYELEGIDLFRTRLATATREHLREEVVRLRWPGTAA